VTASSSSRHAFLFCREVLPYYFISTARVGCACQGLFCGERDKKEHTQDQNIDIPRARLALRHAGGRMCLQLCLIKRTISLQRGCSEPLEASWVCQIIIAQRACQAGVRGSMRWLVTWMWFSPLVLAVLLDKISFSNKFYARGMTNQILQKVRGELIAKSQGLRKGKRG